MMAVPETKTSLADTASECDILKIISNLPSGWKVVGLTELDHNRGSVVTPRYLPPTLVEKGNEHAKSTTISHKLLAESLANETNQGDVLKAITSCSDQVICGKKNVPSVSGDSSSAPVLPPLNISPLSIVNTECRAENRHVISAGGKNENRCDPHSLNVRVEAEPSIIKSENVESSLASTSVSQSFESSDINKESQTTASDLLMPFGSESKWTVVGVTPLPQLQDSNPALVASNLGVAGMSLPLPHLLPSSENQITTVQQNQTILKIPEHPFQGSNLCSPAIQTAPDASSLDSSHILDRDSQVMRWTVVGITTALSSTSTPYLMAAKSGFAETATSSSSSHPHAMDTVSSQSCGRFTESLSVGSTRCDRSLNAQSSLQPMRNDVTEKGPKLLHQNGSLLPPTFQGISSVTNADTHSQIASEWRVVGVSSLPGPSSTFSDLPNYESQLLPHLNSHVLCDTVAASSKILTTTAVGMVTASSLPSHALPSVMSSSFGARTTNSYLQANKPKAMPTLPQDCASNFVCKPSDLPFTQPTLIPSTAVQPETALHHLLGRDTQALGHTPPTIPSGRHDNVQFDPMGEAQNSQWKVVGVFSNSQVSLLPQEEKHMNYDIQREAIPVTSPPVTTLNSGGMVLPEQRQLNKRQETEKWLRRNTCLVDIEREEKKGKSQQLLSTTMRHWSSSSNCDADFEKKKQLDWNRRAKDMLKKKDTSKLKKNTVSNLLKMKRYQGNSPEPADHFADHDLVTLEDEVPKKRCRSRSLRSYSGNRRPYYNPLSGRTQGSSVFDLRNSSDIFGSDHNSEEEVEANHTIKMEQFSPPVSPLNVVENHSNESSYNSMAHSPARRRKLKVPRKMVADVDYHPFDSSSDSN